MKDSITRDKNNLIMRMCAYFFWFTIWQLIGHYLDNELLLPMPITVIRTLLSMMGNSVFYITVLNTFLRIILGFLISCIVGILLSILSYNFVFIRILLSPLISFIKSTPLASIIILTLVWVKSSNLSIFIAFFVVLPTVYTNMLKGLDNADQKLLEMAQVFRVNKYKKVRYIYLPTIKPYLIAAFNVSLGFCWKAGIAAEVIGLPQNSIGEALYSAKIYLNTPELFAWTLFIILISASFEKFFITFMKKI
ncbi:ABC transporter permease subunit [Tissierella sp. Yu-01]|uniref:ABC transporter permease n=1 Tax=Tissierella sp. Yu-01 TaxID=3035694 RepID=UPI00240E208C|nr:ABC transporter permease subunit [Tissierella sp. Yu-01]WFA09097.1 ABC transporter permease subunit [Tissierella sp. Yu-01]